MLANSKGAEQPEGRILSAEHRGDSGEETRTRTFVSKTKPDRSPLIQDFFELLPCEPPFACLAAHVVHDVVKRAGWSVQRSPRLQARRNSIRRRSSSGAASQALAVFSSSWIVIFRALIRAILRPRGCHAEHARGRAALPARLRARLRPPTGSACRLPWFECRARRRL